MESNDKLKESDIKNVCVIISMTKLNLKLYLDHILIDEQPYQIIFVYVISYKTLIDARLKYKDLLELMTELDI